MKPADVVIVGAGVIGAAIAYTLSRCTNLRIVVVERGTPGCEASNAAAGVLAVANGRARRGVLLDLRRRSAAMFPELVAALESETGIDLGYQTAGLLSLALSDSAAAALRDLVGLRAEQGMRSEMLSGTEVRSLEPALHPAVGAAAHFPEDRAIHSANFVAALVAAARKRGGEFRLNTPVRSLRRTNGDVTLDLHGETLHAGRVVVAAGAWSGELADRPGIKVPVRPARGEMAAVRATTWQLRHVLAAGNTYIVPRQDGTVAIGSTMAFVGFDKRVTESGVGTLLAQAAQLLPDVRQAEVCGTWAGLRPCSTIRRPIIAPLPGLEQVILATGHHRNGILLAPITAQLVTELITGATPSVPLRPLSYRRH